MFSNMWNLRKKKTKTDEHRGKERKIRLKKTGREAKRKRRRTPGNKQGRWSRGGWGMGACGTGMEEAA